MFIDKRFQTLVSEIKTTDDWQFKILVILLKLYDKCLVASASFRIWETYSVVTHILYELLISLGSEERRYLFSVTDTKI